MALQCILAGGNRAQLDASGVTAGSYGPSSNASPAHSGTFSVPYVTVDKYGRVTAASTKTITLPSDNNTDTKVTNTLGTTTKAYVTGTTSSSTNTGTQIFDTGVYLSTTAGDLTATTFTGSGANLTSLNATNISSGTLAAARLATSGVTAGSYGPSANASPAHAGTFSVPYITVDTYGRVTSASTKTITLPSDNNTDVNVTNTLATTTKAYVTGTTSASTNTGTQVFDTGVYLDTTAGRLTATTFNGGHVTTTTNPTSSTTYYPTWVTGSGTALRINDGFQYISLQGAAATDDTAAVTGYGILKLGNSTASGTDANKHGRLRLYGNTAYYYEITGNEAYPAANRTVYMPRVTASARLVALNSTGTAAGSTTQPCYVSSTGIATAMTGALATTYGGTGNTTGTATYATTATTTSTFYPIGVTSSATTSLVRNTRYTMSNSELVFSRPSQGGGLAVEDSTTGTKVAVEVGSGGTNHGVWSYLLNKWMVYGNDSTVYLNGNAATATADASGNTITSSYKRYKYAIVGQSSSTTTNPYYKFAQISTSATYSDPWIVFKVTAGYGDSSTVQGILIAHFRTTSSGYWDSGQLVWEYANSGIDPANFIMAHNASASPTVVELWCNQSSAYRSYHFEVISSGNRTTFSNPTDWTLYTTITAGSASEVTSDYTQITSTLATLKNGISGNAATATALATARTIQTNLASTSAASFDGSADVTPGVTGTLPLANGGTGKATAPLALYALVNGSSALTSSTIATGDYFALGDVSATTGKKITLANLMTYINSNASISSADKLSSAVTIDGVSFDGSAAITHYGTCDTVAATAAKVVTCDSTFSLVTGARIVVLFNSYNSTDSPTLNVNSTGAYAIVGYGTTPSDHKSWSPNSLVEFVFDGTSWVILSIGNEGFYATATGTASHAEGYYTTATGNYSHAEGYYTTATGNYSHAEGYYTEISSGSAHAEGYHTIASGTGGHAEGSYTSATGGYSHASGSYTTALAFNTTIGKRNSATTGGSSTSTTGDAFIIGNGTSSSALSNAFRVTYAGAAYGLSAFNSSGADYAEFIKEWYDGNPNSEDRVGYFVTIYDGYLYKADEGDYIVGITSGNPSIVGNGDENYYWRYERDEFNRFVYEDVAETTEQLDDEGNPVIDENGDIVMVETGNIIKNGRMKISDDYDSTQTYIERKDRPEWDYVGMLGVLPVRDDGTCVAGGYCRCADGGIATKADSKADDTYFVIERVTDSVISVILK